MIAHNDLPFHTIGPAMEYARGISHSEGRYVRVVEIPGRQFETRYKQDEPIQRGETLVAGYDCGRRIEF